MLSTPILRSQDCGHLACFLVYMLISLVGSVSAAAQTDEHPFPLIDAHLHYSSGDAETLGAQAVIETLSRAGVTRAAVTSSPPELALDLHHQAPERILPLLGVYRTPRDKENWHQDADLPTCVDQALQDKRWQGVGELHIFAEHRHSPVFLAIVDLASEHGLPILLHADPAVVDRLFDHNSSARVIWAHAGAYPHPPLLRDYLARFPNLYLDLSVRDERIAPDGKLDADWEDFIVEHADRLLIGVDTYRTQRWQHYEQALNVIKTWLSQLPDDVREQLAYQNAQTIFLD